MRKQPVRSEISAQKDGTVVFSVLMYSLLLISGGILCLLNDFIWGASSFALGVMFSALSVKWSAIPAWAKVAICASTVFGVVALIIGIIIH